MMKFKDNGGYTVMLGLWIIQIVMFLAWGSSALKIEDMKNQIAVLNAQVKMLQPSAKGGMAMNGALVPPGGVSVPGKTEVGPSRVLFAVPEKLMKK